MSKAKEFLTPTLVSVGVEIGAVAFLMGLGLFIVAIKARPGEDYCLALRTMIGCFGVLHLFYGFWVLLSTRRAPSLD